MDESIRLLMKVLDPFLGDYFSEKELRRLLFFDMGGLQLDRITEQAKLDDRVFDVLVYFKGQGEQRLAEFARVVVAARPGVAAERIKAVQEAIAAVDALLQAGAGNGGEGAPGAGGPAPWELAAQIGSFVQAYDQAVRQSVRGPTQADSLRKLCGDIRKQADGWDELPDRFHLSESAGERCAAVLALERAAVPRFLRWLVERVIVEQEVAGLIAAQALTCACLRAPVGELARLEAAVEDALELIVGMPRGVERETELRFAQLAIARRRQGVLLSLPRLHLDEVRGVLADAPTWNALLAACLAAQIPVDWLVNWAAPQEHIVFRLVKATDEQGRLGHLLRQAVGTAPTLQPLVARI